MMALLYYQDQNALSKCFLVQICHLSWELRDSWKISLTIKGANSVLVLAVKWLLT